MGKQDKVHLIEFKMMIEGIRCPFINATISTNQGGTRAEIVMVPHPTIFQLIPRTSVQIFFKDTTDRGYAPKSDNKESDGVWRICMDGEFTGFQASDDPDSNHVVLAVRCMRMHYQKTTAGMVFMNPNTFGIAESVHIYTGTDTELSDNESYDVDNLALRSAAQWLKNVVSYSRVKTHGEFMSVFSEIWRSTETYGPVARAINGRVRITKKTIGIRNYSSLNNVRAMLNFSKGTFSPVGQIMQGNTMFSTLESFCRKTLGLLNLKMTHTATPTYYPDYQKAEFVMGVDGAKEDAAKGKYGDKDSLERINQLMALPNMMFTAPPRCNIIFQSLCRQVNYSLGYDQDLTRSMSSVSQVFANTVGFGNSYYFYPKVGVAPGTIGVTFEELQKGSMAHTVSSSKGITGWISRVKGIIKDTMKQQDERQNARREEDQENGNLQSTPQLPIREEMFPATTTEDMIAKINADIKAGRDPGTEKDITKAAIKDIAYKNVFNKLIKRMASVTTVFNPYLMLGFPMVVVKDNGVNSDRPVSFTGLAVASSHSINGETGNAVSSFSIAGFRRIDEPVRFDDYGQPLRLKSSYTINDAGYKEFKHKMGWYKPPVGNARYTAPISIPYWDGGVKFSLNSEIKLGSADKYNGTELPFREAFPYVQDQIFASATGTNTPGAFLDDIYLPQNVDLFYLKFMYRDIFDNKYFPSIMRTSGIVKGSGVEVGPPNVKTNVYDSIHEAIVENVDSLKEISYGAALEQIWRPVCSEGEYYTGIMGCWTKDMRNLAIAAGFNDPAYDRKVNMSDLYSYYDEDEDYYIYGDTVYNDVPRPMFIQKNDSSINFDEKEYFSDCTDTVAIYRRANQHANPLPSDSRIINNNNQSAFDVDRKDMVKQYIASIGGDVQRVIVTE